MNVACCTARCSGALFFLDMDVSKLAKVHLAGTPSIKPTANAPLSTEGLPSVARPLPRPASWHTRSGTIGFAYPPPLREWDQIPAAHNCWPQQAEGRIPYPYVRLFSPIAQHTTEHPSSISSIVRAKRVAATRALVAPCLMGYPGVPLFQLFTLRHNIAGCSPDSLFKPFNTHSLSSSLEMPAVIFVSPLTRNPLIGLPPTNTALTQDQRVVIRPRPTSFLPLPSWRGSYEIPERSGPNEEWAACTNPPHGIPLHSAATQYMYLFQARYVEQL